MQVQRVVPLILFLVVISYLSTAQVLCFSAVYPHTSVVFCCWHKVLSNKIEYNNSYWIATGWRVKGVVVSVDTSSYIENEYPKIINKTGENRPF